MNYDVCVIGTKDTTISLVQYLKDNVTKVDCIITIDSTTVDVSKISGYSSISDFAKKNKITLFEAKDYSLKDQRTMDFFKNNSFGIGICMGWQRLIPLEVLQCFKAGIFGFHGSCGYLPYGRGRSPLNWSIINGDTRFILNLFKYDEKADSPNVYQNRMFEITPFDTIRTLQYKNLITSYDLVSNLIADYKNNSIRICSDSKDIDSLYPKRNAQDGKISFKMKTRDIYNLIRGVTNPFPGAYCTCKNTGEEIKIWDAIPFDAIINFSAYCPGQIVDIFDKMPVIRTIDGSLLIKKYECNTELSKGFILV